MMFFLRQVQFFFFFFGKPFLKKQGKTHKIGVLKLLQRCYGDKTPHHNHTVKRKLVTGWYVTLNLLILRMGVDTLWSDPRGSCTQTIIPLLRTAQKACNDLTKCTVHGWYIWSQLGDYVTVSCLTFSKPSAKDSSCQINSKCVLSIRRVSVSVQEVQTLVTSPAPASLWDILQRSKLINKATCCREVSKVGGASLFPGSEWRI